MKLYEHRKFVSKRDRSSGRTFSSLEFHKCYFESCTISTTRDPRRRSTVRNVRLIDCEQAGCWIDAAIVEDVLVDGFRSEGLFQTWGAVFKHVTLRGKIGHVMTSPAILTGTARPDEQRAFDEANAAYYATVDWALDIREARFAEADLRGIPARLVRRDPQTQFILTRERAEKAMADQLLEERSFWWHILQLFLDLGLQDKVMVAPKAHPRFRKILGDLWALRDKGILEPD